MIQLLIYFLRIQCILLLYVISTAAHAQIYLYQKDGLLGLKNYTDSSIITPAIYDQIEPAYISYYTAPNEYNQKGIVSNKSNFWIVWHKDVCGVINSSGKEVVPITYKNIVKDFLYGYIHTQKDRKKFLVDTTGAIVFETDTTYEQSSKFIYYRDNALQKTKVFNYKGVQVLETDYYIQHIDSTQQFFIACKEKSVNKRELFNMSGKRISNGEYEKIDFIYPFILCVNYKREAAESAAYNNAGVEMFRGFCAMEVIKKKYLSVRCANNNTYKYFDTSGKQIDPVDINQIRYKDYYATFEKAKGYTLYFYDGRLAFDKPVSSIKIIGNRYILKSGDLSYLLDTAGTIVKTFSYSEIAKSSAYPYMVCADEANFYVINLVDGSVVLRQSSEYSHIGNILCVSDQYYCKIYDLKSRLYGLKNLRGELVLPIQYRSIYTDKAGEIITALGDDDRYTYYSAQMKGLYNGISFKNMEIVIPGFLYTNWSTDGRIIVYDRNFKELFRLNYMYQPIQPIKGYYFVGKLAATNKMGLFGMNGEAFIKPECDNITRINDSYFFIVKQNTAYGVLDINGNEIIPVTKNMYCYVENDLLKCSKDNQITAYRITSDSLYTTLDTTYAYIEPIDPDFNYFIVKENEKFGIVNKKGTIVPSVYTNISRWQIYKMLLLKKNDSIYLSTYANPSALAGPYTDFQFANPPGTLNKNNDVIVRQKTKYGIVNDQAKVLLEPKYDRINYKGNGLYIVTSNKKSAIFFKDAFLTPMDIDSIFYMDSNIHQNISFYRNGKYYLLLTDPEEKISAPYSKIKRYNNGKHVIVENNNIYGVLTTKNTFALEMIYQNIKPAGPDGELIIQQQGLYGIASEKGGIIIPMLFDTIQSLYSSKYYRVTKNNLYGVYNNRGKEILPLEYDFIQATGQYFMNQYQKENPDKGYVNFSANAYEGVKAKPNRFIVKQHNQYGVVDSSRHVLIPIQYDLIVDDGPGYVITKDGRSGYADNTGKILISPAYEAIRKVYDANAYYIYQHQKCGVLSNAKLIIKPQYDSITYDAERKMYTVIRNDSSGMTDTSGVLRLPMGKYEFLLPDGDESYCFVKNDANAYAIFSFTEKKLLTPFVYRYYKAAYADRRLYFILYAKDNRYLSIYIPGTEDSPPEPEYEKIIFNVDLKQFELYYTSKDGKEKYRTYTPKRVLSKPMKYKEE